MNKNNKNFSKNFQSSAAKPLRKDVTYTSPNKTNTKSRVMLEFDKFLNANLGRLNKYEQEVKKELSKLNKETAIRSKTPTQANKQTETTRKPQTKPGKVTTLSKNRLDLSKPKLDIKTDLSKNKFELKAEPKKREVNNIKSIKKDEFSNSRTFQKTGTTSANKSESKHAQSSSLVNSVSKKDSSKTQNSDRKKPQTQHIQMENAKNELSRSDRLKTEPSRPEMSKQDLNRADIIHQDSSKVEPSPNQNKRSSNPHSDRQAKAETKIANQIMQIREKPKDLTKVSKDYVNSVLRIVKHKISEDLEVTFKAYKKIAINYVADVVSNVGLKLIHSEMEIQTTNERIRLRELKEVTDSYTDKLFKSVFGRFRLETRLRNESDIKDHLLVKVASGFMSSVFLNLKSQFRIQQEIDSKIQNDLAKTNNSILKQSEVESKRKSIKSDKPQASQQQSRQGKKNSIEKSNFDVTLEKKPNSDRKSIKIGEDKVKKGKASIVQQNIFINNTYIDNSPTIVLNLNKKCQTMTEEDFKKEIPAKIVNSVRKSIKNETSVQYGSNENNKKSVFKPPQRPSINKQNTMEENKEKLNNFKRNLEKLNSLVEKNQNSNRRQSKYEQQQQIIEHQLERDKSEASISSKTMDRLNRSRSKVREQTQSKEKMSQKPSAEFLNKIESLNKVFLQQHSLGSQGQDLPNFGTKAREEEVNHENDSFVQAALEKPMRKANVSKKSKIFF